MRVDTSRFEFSHGRKPKGFGMWAFIFTSINTGEVVKREYMTSGFFTEAKIKAVKMFKQENPATPIYLMEVAS